MRKNDDFEPCTKCGKNWLSDPAPMVQDNIWAAMGMKPGDLLCSQCAWPLVFRDCPWNDIFFNDQLKIIGVDDSVTIERGIIVKHGESNGEQAKGSKG